MLASYSKHNTLATVALLGAVVILAWVCVDIAQRFVPALFGSAADTTSAATASPQRPSLDYRVDELVGAHLFGVAAQPQAPVQAAPETRLRLTLLGVMASTDEGQARAVIASDAARDQSYAIGEQIEGTDAKLYAIEKDRVIIERGRALEKLSLERVNLSNAASLAGAASPDELEPIIIEQEAASPQTEEAAAQHAEEAMQPEALPPDRQPLAPRTQQSPPPRIPF